MDYQWLFKRIRILLLDSQKGWEEIRYLNEPEPLLRKKLFYPLLILLGISHFIGVLFAEGERNFANSLWFTLAHLISIFFGYYIASWSIQRVGISFSSQLSKERAFQYIANSMLPFLLITVLINFAPSSLYFLKLLYLYSFYLLWQGSKILLEVPEQKQLSFVLIALFILYAGIRISLFVSLELFPVNTIKPGL